jgi:hypothetical protein
MATSNTRAMKSKGSSSPLLNLPKPIKDKIYHHALVADKPIDFAKKAFLVQYALPNTCSQIRDEATQIFYSQNVFVISNLDSESTNFMKAANGAITKILIDFVIPAGTRKQYKNQPTAILTALKPRAYHLPEFLLQWGPSAKHIKIIWPEMRNGKFSTDQRIIYNLNLTFKQQLLAKSQPAAVALRKAMRRKMDEFVARENATSGTVDKVGMKGADLPQRLVDEMNGGRRLGLGGLGVDISKFLADLSIDEKRQLVKDYAREYSVDLDTREQAQASKKGGEKHERYKETV